MSTTSIKETITARLREVEDERADLLVTLRTLNRLVVEAEGDAVADDGPMYAGVEIDFTGAGNLTQRLVRIALAVDGLLVINEMAQCLIERSQSKAKPENLRSHISNALSGDPDFRKIDAATYEYVPKTTAAAAILTESTR